MDSDDLEGLVEHELNIAELSDDGETIKLDLDSFWGIALDVPTKTEVYGLRSYQRRSLLHGRRTDPFPHETLF